MVWNFNLLVYFYQYILPNLSYAPKSFNFIFRTKNNDQLLLPWDSKDIKNNFIFII
jgi:hypothetical protein